MSLYFHMPFEIMVLISINFDNIRFSNFLNFIGCFKEKIKQKNNKILYKHVSNISQKKYFIYFFILEFFCHLILEFLY